jgi:hypothetical protein
VGRARQVGRGVEHYLLDLAGRPMSARRRGTALISAVLVVLGLVVIVRTIQAGVGGGLGLVIGAMLVAAGALRLYLATR